MCLLPDVFISDVVQPVLPCCPSQHPLFGLIYFVLIFLVYGPTFRTVRHRWSDDCFEDFVFQFHGHLPITHYPGYFLPLHPPDSDPIVDISLLLLLFVWNTLTVSLSVSTTILLRQDPLRVDVAGLQRMQ